MARARSHGDVTAPARERFRDPRTGFEGWRLRVRDRGPARRGIPTPAVSRGRVFFGGGFGSHEVYAVDGETGRLAWGRRTSDDGPTAATVLGDLVAYNTESCTLEVVDRQTGEPLWSRWLGDPLLAQPALAGERVLMVYPQGGRHWIEAFEARTGESYWKRPLGHDVITAPVVVGERVYLSTFDGTVHCLSLVEGRELWRRAMHATSAPWVYRGEVYVSQRVNGRGRRRGPRRERYPGPDVILDPPNEEPSGDEAAGREPGLEDEAPRGEAVWERTGRVEASLGDAMDAFEAKQAPYLSRDWGSDVKARYHEQDASVGFAHAPASAKIDQIRELVGEGGVARAWRFQGSRPVVDDGVLFETTGDRLEARRVPSGEVLWPWSAARGRAGERRLSPPAAANGRVLAGTWDGRIVSWEARSGRVRWEVPVGAACHWQPVMSGGWIYAGLEDGSLVAFRTGDDCDDGWEMWGGGPGHNGAVEPERVWIR